jgi:acetoin:2,6-dichlorophenolindophenol oxidoreductase subunit alpha
MQTERKRRIFSRMLRIRRLEEAVDALAARKLVIGHYHLYIGQESAGASVIEAARPDDLLLTMHRNHGHLAARGADPGKMLAEFLGKETGLNKGRGGTLHATDASLGFLQTSALIGGVVSLAIGAGYALKHEGKGRVAICFFGDGALEEGAVFESFNIAALWKLPVIFVCENNSVGAIGQAGGGYTTAVSAATEFTKIPKVFDIETRVFLDGNDVLGICEATTEAIARAAAGEGPTFIETVTTRWPGSQPLWPELATGITDLAHARDGVPPDLPHADYMAQHDPVLRIARELLAEGVAFDSLAAEDAAVVAEMDAAQRFAMDSKEPSIETAQEYVYA